MAEVGDTSNDPIFRASKRRKIFRRRLEDDDTEQPVFNYGANLAGSGPDAIGERAETEEATMEEAGARATWSSSVRRAGMRKAGVAFTSGRVERSDREADDASSTSVVRRDAPTDVVQNATSRFMAPTGQAVLTEDKHM